MKDRRKYYTKTGKVWERAGVAYWESFGEVRAILSKLKPQMPHARIVEYQAGFAIQVRISGDYIGSNLRPSMENASNPSMGA